jgi:hypothetical protein
MSYYVYAYLREDNTPYYIGKGTRYRAWAPNHKGIGVPKDRSKIKMLFENLPEELAHAKEKELIRFYGRKDLGTGILYNRTDGGEGASGRLLSQDSKDKIRQATQRQHASGKSGFVLGHASTAGSIGGRSKSFAKKTASLKSLEKTRDIHRNSIWIYNPITAKRKRIKEEKLAEFLSQGYVKGFRK